MLIHVRQVDGSTFPVTLPPNASIEQLAAAVAARSSEAEVADVRTHTRAGAPPQAAANASRSDPALGAGAPRVPFVFIYAGDVLPESGALSSFGVAGGTAVSLVCTDGRVLPVAGRAAASGAVGAVGLMPSTAGGAAEGDPDESPADGPDIASVDVLVPTLSHMSSKYKAALEALADKAVLLEAHEDAAVSPLEAVAREQGAAGKTAASAPTHTHTSTHAPSRGLEREYELTFHLVDALGRRLTTSATATPANADTRLLDALGTAITRAWAMPLGGLCLKVTKLTGADGVLPAEWYAEKTGVVTMRDAVRLALRDGRPSPVSMCVLPHMHTLAIDLDAPIATRVAYYGIHARARIARNQKALGGLALPLRPSAALSSSSDEDEGTDTGPLRLTAPCVCCGVPNACMEPRVLCPCCSVVRSSAADHRSRSPPRSGVVSSDADADGYAYAVGGESVVIESGALPRTRGVVVNGTLRGSIEEGYTWRDFASISVRCGACGYAGPPRLAFLCRGVRSSDGTSYACEEDAPVASVTGPASSPLTNLEPCPSATGHAGRASTDRRSVTESMKFLMGDMSSMCSDAKAVRNVERELSSRRRYLLPTDLTESDATQAVLRTARIMLSAANWH